MPITQEAGQALGREVLAAFKAGFEKNNHDETCGQLFADECSWNWSDGFQGQGPKEKIFEQLKSTWGAMVCSFTPAAPQILVDTDNAKIVTYINLVICIDGGFPDMKHVVHNPCCFICGVNDEGKINQYDGIWDNSNPDMKAALGAVMAKMEEAKASS